MASEWQFVCVLILGPAEPKCLVWLVLCEQNKSQIFTGEKKILPKKATRNVTLAALLIEEVTKRLTLE